MIAINNDELMLSVPSGADLIDSPDQVKAAPHYEAVSQLDPWTGHVLIGPHAAALTSVCATPSTGLNLVMSSF